MDKTFVEKVAEVIKSHISGRTEEDERERKHFVLDGFEEAAAEIEKIVEEMLPESQVLREDIDISEDDDEIYFVRGWNACLAEIRRRLKGDK
jgi:hypothetical protein